MSLEQVAKHAKVSTATVSRVLNDARTVKTSTRARVLKAIKELKYHPNLHARSLAGGKSRTIGVIASNLGNPFFFDIYHTLETDVHTRGYEIIIANTDYRPAQLVKSIRLMIGRRVAGLAVIVSEMEEDLVEELHASGIPVVFYDVGSPGANIATIRVDYRRGIQKVVDYLHSLGHRRVGFVGHHATLGPINDRMRAVLDAVSDYASLEVRTAVDADSPEGGRNGVRSLLSSGFAPSAIICVNDMTAIGALRELRDRGIRVPTDMSVTGFDNITLSEFCYPPLTTVHIPRDRIGHIISDCLIPDADRTPSLEREFTIDPEFIVRGSSGLAPKPA